MIVQWKDRIQKVSKLWCSLNRTAPSTEYCHDNKSAIKNGEILSAQTEDSTSDDHSLTDAYAVFIKHKPESA